jgi:uncharacterized protein (UPF0261 family)
MADKTILVIGTYDTKSDELGYLVDCIVGQGGAVLTIDVSVLGDPAEPTDISKHQVAQAGGSTIQAAIDSGDENTAMQIMAKGAAKLAAQLFAQGKFDGMVAMGGSMGTDLALDVALALPVGVPKYIISTISFSPLLPPQRLASDIQMILWAGGLYGLNSICKASLSQAAGAVLGAARAVEKPPFDKPLIGMTSLGSSALKYMLILKPALEERGFEVAIFHATGMGGRAFESLCAEGTFACVFDFCPQELGNHAHGSTISAGPDRLRNAGLNGTPQLVTAGCYDLVDFIGWQGVPEKWSSHVVHAHNRLISSVVLDSDERRVVARAFCDAMATAKGPVSFLTATDGYGEWDRPGGELRDTEGLAAFRDEMEKCMPDNVENVVVDGHINDPIFAQTALQIFDQWLEDGTVARP